MIPALAAFGGDELSLFLLYVLFFVGTLSFLVIGLQLFRREWRSYEERYLELAEKDLEAIFIGLQPEQLLYLRIACFFAGYLFVYLLTEGPIVAAVFAVAASLLPDLVIRILKHLRLKRFNEQLVDALTTLSNSLKSGSSLPMAFELISRDLEDPIAQEFRIVVQELRLGLSVDEALKNLLKRMPSPELELLVTSVGIAQEVGGNLTEVFDKIAHVIRERTRIEGRIRALTAQGKLQAYVVVCLPPAIACCMYFIDPQLVVPLFTTTVGYVALGVMALMTIIGFTIIRKIVMIDV